MNARIHILTALILLPSLVSAEDKPSAPPPKSQTQIRALSEVDMQKFLQRVRPDLFNPDAYRIAMNWKSGRAANPITIATPKVVSRKIRSGSLQGLTLADCDTSVKRDTTELFYERNDRCGAIFQTRPFRDPPRDN